MNRGFVCGAFDLMHPGHIHMLREAKNLCDNLTVGLHTDPSLERREKNKPIQSVFERYMQLSSLRLASQIIPYDTERDLYNMLATLDLQTRFLGSDYNSEAKEITGWQLCIDRGITTTYIPRLHSWSSSELRNRLQCQE